MNESSELWTVGKSSGFWYQREMEKMRKLFAAKAVTVKEIGTTIRRSPGFRFVKKTSVGKLEQKRAEPAGKALAKASSAKGLICQSNEKVNEVELVNSDSDSEVELIEVTVRLRSRYKLGVAKEE